MARGATSVADCRHGGTLAHHPRPETTTVQKQRRARLAAFSLYDFADSAFATTIVSVLFSQYFSQKVAGDQAALFGHPIPGPTLWAWCVALAMTVVALLGPVLGALADRGGVRVRALFLFWLPGVVLTCLLSLIDPGEWILGAILFTAAYVAFAAASIFYNALLPEVAPTAELGEASGFAWGIGYLGGSLLLVLNLLMLQRPALFGFADQLAALKACFASAGVWWFLFSLPLFFVFRGTEQAVTAGRNVLRETQSAIAQVTHTGRELLRQRNLVRFFFSYLLYNDGVQTIVTMAAIFGAEELGMSPSALIVFFLLIQATAVVGSILLGRLADRLGHRPAIMISVVAFAILTLWASFVGIFGNALIEYWVLGGIAGIFLGGIQSASRSWIAHWIPVGREAELFGFFAIMSRVAAIFGPLVYGALVLTTGSLRHGILAVSLFFVAGGLLLRTVRPEAVESERNALTRA